MNYDPFSIALLRNEIAVESAQNELYFETGLMSVYNDSYFMEADVAQAQEKKGFIGFIQRICNAIRRFISDLLEMIGNVGKDNATADDYMNSETGKVQFSGDVKKIQETVDDECRKGNKLIQMIANTTGVSDEDVDKFIKEGTSKLAKLAGAVTVTKVVGWGFKKFLWNGFKKNKKETDDAEKTATSVDDPEKQKMISHVLTHMNNMITKYSGKSAKEWLSAFGPKNKKKQQNSEAESAESTSPPKDTETKAQ